MRRDGCTPRTGLGGSPLSGVGFDCVCCREGTCVQVELFITALLVL